MTIPPSEAAAVGISSTWNSQNCEKVIVRFRWLLKALLSHLLQTCPVRKKPQSLCRTCTSRRTICALHTTEVWHHTVSGARLTSHQARTVQKRWSTVFRQMGITCDATRKQLMCVQSRKPAQLTSARGPPPARPTEHARQEARRCTNSANPTQSAEALSIT